jgi:hypothetical protein
LRVSETQNESFSDYRLDRSVGHFLVNSGNSTKTFQFGQKLVGSLVLRLRPVVEVTFKLALVVLMLLNILLLLLLLLLKLQLDVNEL